MIIQNDAAMSTTLLSSQHAVGGHDYKLERKNKYKTELIEVIFITTIATNYGRKQQ